MRALLVGSLGLFLCSGSALAHEPQGEQPSAVPGVIVRGSTDVAIGGLGAARADEQVHDGSTVEQGSTDVFINGRPATTVGDRTHCGSVVVRGSSNVFINGKPAARIGDVTSGCPGQ